MDLDPVAVQWLLLAIVCCRIFAGIVKRDISRR